MALGTTNISTTLVGTTLGTSSRDVGTLCTHSAINKWSKWKPIRLNKVTGITESDLATADYGLIPTASSTNYANVVSSKWAYNQPRGGDYNEPYRLGDFRNYDHGAPAICGIPASEKANRTFANIKQIGISVNVSGTSLRIGLSDFLGAIGAYYFGVIIVDGSSKYIKTASADLANSGYTLDLDLEQAPFNTDKVVELNYILANASKGLTNLDFAGTISYLPLPTSDTVVNKTSLTITSGLGLTVELMGIGLTTSVNDNISTYTTIPYVSFPTSGALYTKLKLTNTTNEDVVIPSGTWQMTANPSYFGTNTNKHNATLYNNSGTVITSVTVPANSYVVVVVGRDNLLNMNGTMQGTPTPPITQISDIGVWYNNFQTTGQTIQFQL